MKMEPISNEWPKTTQGLPTTQACRAFGDGKFTGLWENFNDEFGSIKSSFADWIPEQIAQGKLWMQAWKVVGKDMEQLRRAELRRLDPTASIALLCGPADYRTPPRAPKPTSGLENVNYASRNSGFETE